MSRKIFFSIFIVSSVVMILVMAMGLWGLYNHFTEEQFEQLRNETQLVRQGLTMSGSDFFDNLRTTNFRMTWITRDGRILYDSDADSQQMANHLEREEIREALETGYGESQRFSSTLSAKQLYTAQLMDDGTVIRLSVTQSSISRLFRRRFIQTKFCIGGFFKQTAKRIVTGRFIR